MQGEIGADRLAEPGGADILHKNGIDPRLGDGNDHLRELLEFVAAEYHQPSDIRITLEYRLHKGLAERTRAAGDEYGCVV